MATISRRQVLTVAGLTIGVAVVEYGSPAAADPVSDAVTLVPVGDQPVPVLTADRQAPAVCPKQLAVKVVTSGAALPAGSKVAVTYDRRLFAPVQPAVVSLGGRRAGATSAITDDAASTTCTVTLTEAVPAQPEALVVLGTARPFAYPHDIVRSPRDASADAVPAGRQAVGRRSLQPPRPPAFGGPDTPWAVALGAVWERRGWGPANEFWYWYPSGVTVAAGGPGRMPAPVAFAVAVDPQVVRSLSVASARLNGKPFKGSVRPAGTVRTASVYETRWQTSAVLSPGDLLDVRFHVTTTTPAGPLATVKHPVVTGLTGALVTQRTTGRETVSRQDSSWQ